MIKRSIELKAGDVLADYPLRRGGADMVTGGTITAVHLPNDQSPVTVDVTIAGVVRELAADARFEVS